MTPKSLALICTLLIMPYAALGSDATGTMANIMMDLKHFPNDAQKAELAAITDEANADATADEKMLAGVISRVAHQASAEDKVVLQQMLDNPELDHSLHALAKAVKNMNHQIQGADVGALKALAHR